MGHTARTVLRNNGASQETVTIRVRVDHADLYPLENDEVTSGGDHAKRNNDTKTEEDEECAEPKGNEGESGFQLRDPCRSVPSLLCYLIGE